MPGIKPCAEISAPLFERERLVVSKVVGVAHEGVDGTNGVSLVARQGNKGVVEVFGFPSSDFAAYPVGFVNR
jgi:hypothetical protein